MTKLSSGYVVLDIETVALPQAAEYLDPVEAPANYKDPAKIAAYCAEKQQDQIDKAALDPDLCRLVCLGWWREGENEPQTYVIPTDEHERKALSLLWRFVSLDTRGTHAMIVGYNTLGFDLPILMRRSLYLKVQAPALNLDRYRTPHVDLMQRLSHNGLLRTRSLNFYCRRFGLNVPSDPVKGTDIAALVEADDWLAIEAHCASDVRKTAMLAERMGLIRQVTAVSER